ncbi:hypothetical protein [Chthonobacter albigriseus]|uniref:hypothetical protein n=1 Tax=Chthonobacter albigriseus TaxID=1683161 RepID=UPI0015EF5E25|nr:hypothetical protein [Chthonobacter albigriseus]
MQDLAARLAAVSATLLLSIGPASADELSDKLCPLLKEARTMPGADQIQMHLVFGLASLYEDPADLGALPPKADAAAEAACPEDRAEVLKRSEYGSLESILR